MRPFSQNLFEAAKKIIAGGVNSPVRAFKAVGGNPIFIQSAHGAYLTDVDGSQYIDYVGSWGPMILGHAHPAVIAAVKHAVDHGLSFGAPCELEIQLAAEICQRFDSIEKVRMVNSGTEAAMTAIRLARGATGRDKILKFEGGYHGHLDSLLVKAGSGALTFGSPTSPGIPQSTANDTLIANYNDIDSVTEWFEHSGNEIACIIVEPIAGNMNLILPKPGFLEALRDISQQYGSLLIFDEVITGCRVGLQGMQSHTPVRPDITILGKIIGGGLPVGAIGARADIMDQLSPQGPIYQAGTLSGNPIAMAAGLATLQQLTAEKYAILSQKTRVFAEKLSAVAAENRIPLRINYHTGLFGLFFTNAPDVISYQDVMQCDAEKFRAFFQCMLNQGVYFAPSIFEAGFMSLAHCDADIAKTIAAAEAAFHTIKTR